MPFPNKFRIWQYAPIKRWLEPSLGQIDFNGCLYGYYPSTIIDQWTGLVDAKTNQLIYENDIVSFTIHGAAHGRERDDTVGAQVWWCQEIAGWAFGKWTQNVELFDGEKWVPTGKTYDWWYSAADDGFDLNALVVMGNIHENVGLLTHPIVK